MTRTLILVRHGEAAPAGDDSARPLTARGVAAAKAQGQKLAALGLTPSVILSSTARRAIDTAGAMLESWPEGIPVLAETGLYLAEPRQLADRVRQLDDGLTTVLLVGHNPGLSAFCLAHGAQGMAAGLMPAACAVLQSDAPGWARFGPAGTRMLRFLPPGAAA